MKKLPTRPNTGKWTTVPNTHKWHSIRNVVGTNKINMKNFLCMCRPCLNGEDKCENKVCPDVWHGFDLATKKNVSPNFEDWNVCPICKNSLLETHCEYWSQHIQNLSTITLLSDLISYIHNNPIPALNVNIDMQMYESDKNFLDFVALHYLPRDAPDSHAPINIVGDGNCFTRAVSFVLFRTQKKHCEIRTRIVYEGLLNMELYLDNSYLSKGTTHFYCRGTPADQCAMYSDNYNPDRNLDVRAILHTRVVKYLQRECFHGYLATVSGSQCYSKPCSICIPRWW